LQIFTVITEGFSAIDSYCALSTYYQSSKKACNSTSSLAAFSWHLTFLLMSAYDHVQPFQHCYLHQPTVFPCQPQASFFFVSTAEPHQKLLFFFCTVTACVFKLFFSKYALYFCLALPRANKSCLLLIPMYFSGSDNPKIASSHGESRLPSNTQFFGPTWVTPQTASWLVQPFMHSSPMCPTHVTDTQTTLHAKSVATGHIYAMHVMEPKNL